MSLTVEDHQCYRLVTLSLKISASVLRRIIIQYCDVQGLTFSQLLDIYKHELFHYYGNRACCQCTKNVIKGIIQEGQWSKLYDDISASLPSAHPHIGHNKYVCPDQYAPGAGVNVDVCDVSLACTLIINIAGTISSAKGSSVSALVGTKTATNIVGQNINMQSLLEYTIDQLCLHSGGFQNVLNTYKHTLYHGMIKERCCQCSPQDEWSGKGFPGDLNQFYSISQKKCSARLVCCCQYNPRHNVSLSNISPRVRHILGQHIGPWVSIRSVRNEIAHSRDGRVDSTKFRELWNTLSGNLDMLINIIQDPTWAVDIRSQITNLETCAIDGPMWDEHRKNLALLIQEMGAVGQRIDTMESNISNVQHVQVQAGERMDTLASDIQLQANMIAENRSMIQGMPPVSQEISTDTDKKSARDRLVNKYEDVTQCVEVMPLGDMCLPLDQFFAPVVVADNKKPSTKARDKDQEATRKLKPADIFTVEGKPAKRVFMKGEAGRGKTVYTIKLISEWRKYQQRQQSEMQEVLSKFDLLFYVPMRYVKKKRNKIRDMICDCMSDGDAEAELFRRVLHNKDIHCLVILDGLDEWSSSSNTFPDSNDLVNCVIFTSSRPWKLERLFDMQYTPKDKVVEILGIDPKSIYDLITRIVTHLCGSDNPDLENKISRCEENSLDPMMESLLTLPLILTAACHVWCEEDEDIMHGKRENVLNSKTYFILSIQDLFLKRSGDKCKPIDDYLQKQIKKQNKLASSRKKRQNHTDTMNLFFRHFRYISRFIDILNPFFKLAYDDLLSSETRLVFEKYMLEEEIGKDKVDLALQIGIISQCKAPGCFNIRNVRVSYHHKLIQELMAALHITCNKDMIEKFCNGCNSVDKIKTLDNVILFVSGLDNSLGSRLSKHITRIAEEDHDLILWRQTMNEKDEGKVKSLYFSQLEWYSEMNHVCTMMNIPPPPYHVSDIFLDDDYSADVRVTEKLVSNTCHTIISVYLTCVPDISGIIYHLPQHSTTLTALFIGRCNEQSREVLATVLPRLAQLHFVCYGDHNCEMEDSEVDNRVVAALNTLTQIKSLELKYISLSQPKMHITRSMTQLESLVLTIVYDKSGIIRELPQHSTTLTTLHIVGCLDEERELLATVLPHLDHLQYVLYDGVVVENEDENDKVVAALSRLTRLESLDLCSISLSDTILNISTHMTQLKWLELEDVRMSASGWNLLLSSLLSLQHTVQVTLCHTNIDDDSLTRVHSSLQCTDVKNKLIQGWKKIQVFSTVPAHSI